jgi:hypothetical protein
MPTRFSAIFASDSIRHSRHVAALEIKKVSEAKSWTDEDESELELARRNFHGVMAKIARKSILPFLDDYRRPTAPERPGRFPRDDARVAALLRDVGRKERKSKKDKVAMTAWADHVRAVQACEASGSSRVKALLTYQRHAELASDEETADTIGAFLAREWGYSGDVPADVDALAVELARRRDVISDRLMYGDHEPSKRDDGPRQLCAPEVM